MNQQKKIRYLKISIILSATSIILTLLINCKIAKAYLRSDGKTRALFSLQELLRFGYQYYLVLPGIIALVLAILCIKSNSSKTKKITAIVFSVLAVTIVFLRIWSVFV